MSNFALEVANVVLTNKCNSKCISCDYWRIHDICELDMQSIESFFGILNDYSVSHILLTGGEPTIHSRFNELVRLAKEKYGFKIILSTNGIGLNSVFNSVRDYVDSYCISFDGHDPPSYERIRGVDNFTQLSKDIKSIKEQDKSVHVFLGCLVQRSNYENIELIYRSARDTGANGLYFNVPDLRNNCFGRDRINESDAERLLVPTDCFGKLDAILDRLISLDNGSGFLCQQPDVLRELFKYFKYMHDTDAISRKRVCSVPLSTVVLTERSTIKPCFYFPIEFPYVIGEDPLSGDEFNKFRAEFLKFHSGECSSCFQYMS